ncbi:MAG: TM1812 family CRISPR-associated protein [Xanthomonadales bacterium]|nr:TM1812 family CRISPR-associated protein [Xanthomonadales bacterium]
MTHQGGGTDFADAAFRTSRADEHASAQGAERARTLLISFLGTGNYQSTRYYLESDPERGIETCYCAHAIAQLRSCSTVAVLVTPAAEQAHWRRLEERLSGLAELRKVPIDLDGGPRAFDRLLQKMVELAVDKPGEVIIDITHSFRALPFFAGALVAYLHARRPELPVSVLYGAYEARDEHRTPIWDLSRFGEVSALIAALEVFQRTGDAEELAQRIEGVGRALAKWWAASRDESDERAGARPLLDRLARKLREFDLALDAVRVGGLLLPEGSRGSLVRQIIEDLDASSGWIARELPLLEAPLAELRDRIAKLSLDQDHLGGESGRKALAALANLYLRLGEARGGCGRPPRGMDLAVRRTGCRAARPELRR